jgi:hypothetical protein
VLPATAFVDGPGMAVHGPMAAEALSSLGHHDEVVRWTEEYVRRHPPHDPPARVARIDADDPSDWALARGDVARLSDWRDLFGEALAQRPWPEVLSAWVPRLLDGYGGFLTHGLLRTSHAIRILEALDTTSKAALDELGMGLAFWAGAHRPLPGTVRLDGHRPLRDAMDRLPRPQGTWTSTDAAFFRPLDELDGFGQAVESISHPCSADPLGELTAAFARAVVDAPGAPIDALVHTVTPVVAMRTLLRHLPDGAATAAYASGWQVGAAILTCFTGARPAPAPRTERAPLPPTELVARAVEHRAPHAIKMVEACLQEHALHPDPIYLLAAERALRELAAW